MLFVGPKKAKYGVYDRTFGYPVPEVSYDETPAADGIPAVVQRPPTRAPVDERKRSRDSGKGGHHLRQQKEQYLMLG